MATVGEDFAPYAKRLNELGLSDANIRTVPNSFTAQAFITTDIDDNQIIAFPSRRHERVAPESRHRWRPTWKSASLHRMAGPQ